MNESKILNNGNCDNGHNGNLKKNTDNKDLLEAARVQHIITISSSNLTAF